MNLEAAILLEKRSNYMLKTLVKYFLACLMCVVALIAYELQKQASAEVGTIPKTIIDKATNDIAAAQELASEQAKAIENVK